jgi:hypothetical protein
MRTKEKKVKKRPRKQMKIENDEDDGEERSR